MNFKTLANPTLIATAAIYGLLLQLASRAGFAGLWLGLLVSLSLWRYCYAVLWFTARGGRNLTPPGIESMNPIHEVSLVLHFVFWFLLRYLIVSTPYLGADPYSPLRWVLFGILLVPFPASAVIMALTRNLAAALNPVHLAVVMRELGWTYVKLLGLLLALAVAVALADQWLNGILTLVAAAISVWTLLAFFALSGMAIAAHREAFDFPGEVEARHERDERWRDQDRQQTLERAYASIRGGLTEQGYRTIKELLAAEGDSLEIHQWTFNRMLAWENKTYALALGQKFIARLVAEGRMHNAVELAQQCRRLAESFSLPPETITRLSEYARSVNRHALADEIERSLPPRSRVSPRAPSP